MFNKTKTKSAFTLAEVLITLVIIGVVAALTIPTAIGYYKKEETVSKLKKFYSTFGQAISRSIIDNGHYSNWDYDEIKSQQGAFYFENNYIFPYLQVVKKCTPTSNECWADNVRDAVIGENLSIFKNSRLSSSSAVLSDGTSILICPRGSYLYIGIDINGHKSPNVVGRDVFTFYLTVKDGDTEFARDGSRAGFRPFMSNATHYSARDSVKQACASEVGTFCTGLIALDGWQIKSDYPHKL